MIEIEEKEDPNQDLSEVTEIYSAAEAGPRSLGLKELLGPEYNISNQENGIGMKPVLKWELIKIW